ncbi:DHA2 family efflux MFS transporter permease subunit [Pedobacter sp. 22163]|uniref:DHA2 family efflux MFS transporter permease subunit n=1 Tax=Pedobacter sp. 22163 TaxID=3453883 RepID=UPI003F829293
MRDKKMVMITLMLGTFMASLDSSIVNVSLPVMQKQFGISIAGIEWVITGYMISFCLFIPLTSWMKRRIGYYRLFLISIMIFTLGSLLCSLSSTIGFLVFARILQAIGGGAISPTSLAILSEEFPQNEKGSAIGWWGIGNVMGPAIGPTLGGVLTHYFGWPCIFYINIPIGLLTIYLSTRHLGFLKNRPVTRPSFDVKGYTYFAIFIVVLQYSLTAASDSGSGLWKCGIGFIASVISLVLFYRTTRYGVPLIDLSVFKSRIFVDCTIIILIRSLALYGGLFFIPFLLQGLMGYSEIQTGLLLLPNALIMLALRPYAGRLADRGIVRNPSLLGIALISVSMLQFSVLDTGSSIVWVILGMIVRGTGMSFLVAPVSTTMLNSVTLEQTATATSLNSLFQQVGGSVGIALSGVLHISISHYFTTEGRAPEMAEHLALKAGFIISAIVIAMALFPAKRLPERHNVKVSPIPIQ